MHVLSLCLGMQPRGGQPIDAHNLASLVFALQLNASAVLDGSACSSQAGGPKEESAPRSEQPALKSVCMGPGMSLVFYTDAKLPGILLAMSLSPGLGERAESFLAESMFGAFAAEFREQLQRQAVGAGAAGPVQPVRRLRGAGKVVQRCLADVSQFLLHELTSTFSGQRDIHWSHAMLLPAHQLEALGIDRPLKVPREQLAGLGGVAMESVPPAPCPAPDFDGLAIASGAHALNCRQDSGRGFEEIEDGNRARETGTKRKAPEKFLSRCVPITRRFFSQTQKVTRACERKQWGRTAQSVCLLAPKADKYAASSGVHKGVKGAEEPTEHVLEDVLELIRAPGPQAVTGLGQQKTRSGCVAPCAARNNVWGALRMWEDEMSVCHGEWRSVTAAAAEAAERGEGKDAGTSVGGCGAFLRSRKGQRNSGVSTDGKAVDAGQGQTGEREGGERRKLVALVSESVVVSLCMAGEVGAACVEEGVNGECCDWIQREEALWRLDSWLNFVFAN